MQELAKQDMQGQVGPSNAFKARQGCQGSAGALDDTRSLGQLLLVRMSGAMSCSVKICGDATGLYIPASAQQVVALGPGTCLRPALSIESASDQADSPARSKPANLCKYSPG